MKNKLFLVTLLLATVNIMPEIVVRQDIKGRIIVSNNPYRTFKSKKKIRYIKPANSFVVPTLYLNKIRKYANLFNISNDLVLAVIRAESNFNPNAVSKKGAIGIMQLGRETAKKYGVVNRFNVDQNLKAGIKHLKYLYARYNKNLPLTLAAYNAGEGAVKKYNGVPPYRETKTYISRVMRYMGLNYARARTKIKIYKYTRNDGRIIITDSIPPKINGRIEVIN